MNLKGRLVERARLVRSSYWFIPGLMAIGAIILSQLAINLDEWLGAKWMERLSFLYDSKPSGARSLLSTIAGSMIGVAGVTFSITIAAVAYASSQFGPRIIDNFMQDKGNQVTLGTFIATFIYCLLVLRIVRDGDETDFVPHLSVFVGVLLALASLAVLIFFIHHIPESIHVSKLVARIGRQYQNHVETVYPKPYEETSDEPTSPRVSEQGLAHPLHVVRSDRDGYVQSYDLEKLKKVAESHSVFMKLSVRPGDFVNEAQPLIAVYGAGSFDSKSINGNFVIGNERSPTQDLRFLSDQLVDIAGRALSPGVNDPQTAIQCVCWLHAGLSRLAGRHLPTAYRHAEDRTVLLQVKEPDYQDYVDSIYDQLRPYLEQDRNAALATVRQAITTLDQLPPSRRLPLIEAVQRLIEGCLRTFEHTRDRAQLAELQQELAKTNSSEALLRAASLLGEASQG